MQKKKKRLQISDKIKLSNTVRMTIVLFAAAIFAFNSGKLLMSFTGGPEVVTEKKEIYSYNNKFSENVHINLIENSYVQENEIIEGQTYLSDLISSIDFDMKYKYTDSKPTEVTYDYKIEATIKAVYSNSKGSYDVLNKTDLIEKQEKEKGNSKNLNIDKTINIDYAKYHEMVKSFKQEIGINLDAYLYIKFTVNTSTKIGSQEVKNKYVSDYSITLGDKIAIIEDNSVPETSDLVIDETQTEQTHKLSIIKTVIRIILMILGLSIIRYVLTKTENMKIIKNEYKLELNRILKSCESKLIQIEDIRQVNIEKATKVKDIYQLLKLSDEALVPIYCYIKDEPENEAYFIVNKYDNSYIYILKK